MSDWDNTAVVTRLSVGSYTGTPEQFSEAYQTWWTALDKKGLFGDTPLAKVLNPVDKGFELNAWFRQGFSTDQSEAIMLAGTKLGLEDERWQPPPKLDGYALGRLIFTDEFTKANDRWKLNPGHWRWERGRLVQEGTFRRLEEGEGWGGRAILDEVADPRMTPLLVEAVGRVSYGVNYGKFGVTVGHTAKDVTSGLECLLIGNEMSACRPSSRVENSVPHRVHTQSTDIQFILLTDGTRLRAKVWNAGTQSEPPHWQVDADLKDAILGSALMLETEIWASWDHVRVWELKRE